MTAFVVNGGATTDWDTLTGGSVNATLDTYDISNGTTLRINTDSYHCANHSAAFGSLDTVTYTGKGGKILVDPSAIRVVPYTGGSGNVPAIGASITQGGVTGVLLGVWANWQSEPTAPAAAMPATGFIKFKSVTGGSAAFAAGALTGITATASEASRQGWLEVRGADTALITVPRIGAFQTVGPNTSGTIWFELGTTNGARAQIIPCPCTGTVAGIWPGVWIETAAGSGVYEKFAGAGSIVALVSIPTDERGKIVWQTTAGIRIGNDGTNGVGYLPPTGCKVRIPAVILTCCTRTAGGSGVRVLPNATLATRQEFVTTASGDIDLDGAVMMWYGNFLQAYSAKINNSALSDTMIVQEIAAPININNNIVAPTQAQANFALNMVSCFGGGTVQNNLFARFNLASANLYVATASYNKGVNFINNKLQTLLNRSVATAGVGLYTQNVDCTWTDCTEIGGRSLHAGSQRPIVTNQKYADNFSGITATANPQYAQEFTAGCVGAKLDGFSLMGITNVQPYSGIMSAIACYESTIRNIGTYAAPLNLGSTNAAGVIFNGGGNNDGIRMQRCYTSNTRTGPYAFLNTDNNVVIQDVKGDYADVSVVTSLNTIAKAVSLTGATTGQTAVYGTHWKDSFVSATVGKVEILCNEPTIDSAAQCAITSGTPQFNSVGQVAMTVVGQQVTWEMPYFAKGHTALANLASTNTGTNPTNLTYEFQCDKGAGYGGTWLTLNAANLTAQGAIDPAIGFKLKVRVTCATANAGNLLTNIAIPTVTTSVAQGGNPYPLDENTLTFTDLPENTEVRVRRGSKTLSTAQDVVGGSYVYTFASDSKPVVVQFSLSGYTFEDLTVTLTPENRTLSVISAPDPSYSVT